MRYAMIAHQFEAFQEARTYLASHGTTVQGRKSALSIRDDFNGSAANYVGELLDFIKELRDYTDGEECADPDSCDIARGGLAFLCSRCRIREMVPEL